MHELCITNLNRNMEKKQKYVIQVYCFIVCIKTIDIYKETAEDIEEIFAIANGKGFTKKERTKMSLAFRKMVYMEK